MLIELWHLNSQKTKKKDSLYMFDQEEELKTGLKNGNISLSWKLV